MGFLDLFLKEEKEEVIEERSGITNIMSIINGAAPMDIELVERIPAAQACANIITNTIASLPIYLYREDKDCNVERIHGDNREFLLNNEPNETQNAFNMKKQLAKDYIYYGASYLKIDWEGTTVSELWNLEADKVQVLKYQNGYKTSSRIKYLNNCELEFDSDEVAQILKDSHDGVNTKGLLHTGQETFKLALNELEYTNKVYTNGSLPLGILKSSNKLSPDALSRLKAAWQSLYTGVNNSNKTVILEEGLDYQALSLDPDKLKLTESKKHTTSEICRLYGIPESIINSSSNKYGSLEMNNLQFIQYCLAPILKSIETALDKSMLLESEKKDGYFFSFDTSEIQKGTEEERLKALQIGLNSGIVSVNEARAKMNLKPIEDDVLKWSLGSVLYYLDEPNENERIFIPNLALSKGDAKSINNIDTNSKKKEVIDNGTNDSSDK